jgi:hypothetical protein
VLYYIIRPHVDGDGVAARLERQAQIAVANNNVIYGTIASTHTGRR